MLEAVPDTIALARRILQQNSKRTELQSLAGDLQAFCAFGNTISFARAARTTRVNNPIIDAQQHRALNFSAKGDARFFKYGCVGGGEVHEVITMNQNRRDLRQTTRLAKEQHVCKRKWFGQPTAWIARKELNGVTTSISRYDESVVHAALNRSMESDLWFTRHLSVVK